MRIAILGATSQIAKDLVLSYAGKSTHELVLFARDSERVSRWLDSAGLSNRYAVDDFGGFNIEGRFDAVINFVGSGNPAQTEAMGASILDVTFQYDEMAVSYVKHHSNCRYVFLSSGAAYGSVFDRPADEHTNAVISINDLKPQDWYAVAKLYAECRHRSLPQLPIVDIRVFNYFSSTQDIAARYLITDILRAIRDKAVLRTSAEYIVRDFLHPSDFYNLVNALLSAPASNAVVDAYSQAPIDKPALLKAMQERFGLRYEVTAAPMGVNATGGKQHYYSLNTRAADFGYRPYMTSLEGIMQGAEKILNLQT